MSIFYNQSHAGIKMVFYGDGFEVDKSDLLRKDSIENTANIIVASFS